MHSARYYLGMVDFHSPRNRDAYPVIRGYRYQIDQTILRWLALDNNVALELERGEDIDRINSIINDGGDGFSRVLEQVKHLTRTITLKSAPCIEALANALEHRVANPEIRLSFRFCTNSRIGIERPSPFSPRRSGIDVWQCIRDRNTEIDPKAMNGIRSILRDASRPTDCTEANWSRFTHFNSSASTEEMVAFIDSFEWGTGQLASEELELQIELQLVSNGHARNEQHARQLYRVLFIAVIKILAKPGLKRLTRPDLLAQLSIEEFTSMDTSLLFRLEKEVLSIDHRLDVVEESVRLQSDKLSALIAEGRNIGTIAVEDIQPLDAELPQGVALAAARKVTTVKLINTLHDTTWLALHGGMGCGKTELSKLIASAGIFSPALFLSLRDLSSVRAELQIVKTFERLTSLQPGREQRTIVQAVAACLSPNGLLVLDDLPLLVAGDGLSRLIVQLCRSCRDRGVKFLTTSHHLPPEMVLDQLPKHDRSVVQVPPFSDDEVRELFEAIGMPHNAIGDDILHVVNIVAEGHPVLLTAIARALSDQKWQAELSHTTQWVRRVFHGTISDEGLRRLIVSVDDETTRRFLYRLCLIQGSFTFQQAKIVSDTHIVLDRPRERLMNLQGMWIQPQQSEHLLVSPLVRPLAHTELLQEERIAVQIALANEIIGRRAKSVLDIASAVGYLTAAGEYDRACVLLIVAFQAAQSQPQNQLQFLLSVSWKEQPLPVQMNLGNRLYLRGYQIKAADRLHLSVREFFLECDDMVNRASKADNWAVFGFSVQTASIRAKSDFAAAMREIKRAAELLQELSATGSPLEGRPDDMGPASLLWFVVTEVRSPEHLHLWLDTLELIEPNEVRHSFGDGRSAYQACQLVVDAVWTNEFEKEHSQRNWHVIDAVLRRAQEVAIEFAIEPLIAAVVRARIIVMADYLMDLDGALKLASDVLDTIRNPLSILLVTESLGRQFLLKKHYNDASIWLCKAVAVASDEMAALRMQARIYLATAMAEVGQESVDVLPFVEEGVMLLGDSADWTITSIHHVIALGELSVARWLTGDFKGCFKAFDDASVELLACRDDSIGWKSLFVMLGHAGGYFVGAARDIAPSHTEDGSIYLPPYRMMFLTAYQNERAALFSDLRITMLPSILAMFAEATGDDERAIYWAEYGIAQARAVGLPSIIASLGWPLVAQFAHKQQYVEAIDAAREASIAGQTAIAMQKQGVAVLTAGVDPSEYLVGDSEAWKMADRTAVDWGSIPIIFSLALCMLDNPAKSHIEAVKLTAQFRALAIESADAEVWRLTADAIEAVFVTRLSTIELNQFANNAARSGNRIAHIIGYLGISLANDVSLENAALSHIYVMPVIEQLIGNNTAIYRRAVPSFIVRFWTDALKMQSFRFSMPAMFKTDLEAAIALPIEERIRAVLKAVRSSLNLKLPENAELARKWLAN